MGQSPSKSDLDKEIAVIEELLEEEPNSKCEWKKDATYDFWCKRRVSANVVSLFDNEVPTSRHWCLQEQVLRITGEVDTNRST